MKKSYFPLILICLLAIVVRLHCFVGLIGSDDLSYNRNAYNIATGVFTPQPNHQDTRLGLFLPVAGIFSLLGVHEISSILFPFACFLVTFLLLVAAATRYLGYWTGVLAGLFYAFLPIEIFHATMLLTDLPSAAFLALSGFFFYRIESESNGGRSTSRQTWLMMFLAGLFWGWAYLIKETAVFFGVFIAGYLIWRRKRWQWAWLAFWFGALLILGGECGYYTLTAGHPFFRYLSVEAGHNVSLFSGRHFQGLALLRRLTIDLFRMVFHAPDFSFSYIFGMAGAIYALLTRKKSPAFFTGWFLSLLFLMNFGSSSISSYTPLLLFSRFFIMVNAPCILLASWYLYEMRNFFVLHAPGDLRAVRFSLLIPAGLFGLITFWQFSAASLLFLTSLSVWILLIYSRPLRNWCACVLPSPYLTALFPMFFLCVNLLPGVYTVVKGQRPQKGLTCEREIPPLLEFPLAHTIYTDERTEEILEYFYAYQEDHRILAFSDVDVQQWRNAYIVVNWERLFFLNRLYQAPIPEFLYHPPPQWRLYQHLGGNVNPCLIYEIP